MRVLRRRLVIWILSLLAVYALLVGLLAAMQDALVFPGAGRGDRGLPDLPGLEAGVVQRSDGGRVRVVTARGARTAAVALYFVGNGEDLFSAAQGAAVLSRYDLEVVGVEHPGYGASDGPTTVATVLAGAEAAKAFAQQRAARLGVPLYAIGSSLGSFCAVHVAAQGGIDRLLLRAPPTTMVAAAHLRFWWLPVGWFLRHRFDNLALAPAVRCPVLVVHGDHDTIVPLQLGTELAAAFGGPSELLVAVGCGHNDLPLDRDGPFGTRLQAFLDSR